jgi:hypothetical protein
MLWRAGKKTKGNSDLVYVQDENIMNYKVSWKFFAKLQNMLACQLSLSNLNVGHKK